MGKVKAKVLKEHAWYILEITWLEWLEINELEVESLGMMLEGERGQTMWDLFSDLSGLLLFIININSSSYKFLLKFLI